jgi:Ca-activated chloride channel family protein
MNSKIDKERLTAWALGELDERERLEVEDALAADEGFRREAEEIRAAAELTRDLFSGAPELTLSDNQREVIENRAAAADGGENGSVVPMTAKRGRLLNWPVLRAAAVFLVVIGAGAIVFYPQFETWREGLPLGGEISPQTVGRRAIEATTPEKRKAEPRQIIPQKPAQGRAGAAKEKGAEDLDETVDAVVPVPGYDQEARAFTDAAAPKNEAKRVPEPTGKGQERELDQETRDRLKSLGYMGDSEEITVTAHAPVIETQKVTIGQLAESAPSSRQFAAGAAPRSHLPPGYTTGGDVYDDPDLNDWPGHNTEAYDRIVDNPFKAVGENPLSTFSIDVDTAAYANMRRFINQGQLPPQDSVRIEELVNYFDYGYEPPRGDTPFSAHVAVAGCPWNSDHRLARVGLKGWEMAPGSRPASNLVFLLDVSGSMNTANKLPLLQQAMGLLVEQLGEKDSVAIAVYAGASGLVLPPTSGDNRQAILGALNNLRAGGSTNGGAGIELAYDLATRNFIKGGVNRVILATDGDFNVGTTNRGDLTRIIEDKAKSGVFLTVLGFGMGNLKDSTMENLADKGNGNYAYIDTIREAKKVLVDEIGSTMVTIAKDVKIQVEFNPAEVSAYRLIGYENRILAAEDFNDDTKDAGEIGAGHTVTALYELVPRGVKIDLPNVDPLKYQQTTSGSRAAGRGELFTIKLRYKKQDGDKSKLLSFPVTDQGTSYAAATPDFKFAAAVASFGMILRDSPHKGGSTFDTVLELAEEGRGRDAHGYRAEFIELVKQARSLR